MNTKTKIQGLASIVDQLRERASGNQRVTVDEALEAFGGRVFGPFLALIGLVVITPLGAIPLVPSLAATLIILIAAQRVFGRRHPWIPRKLRERSVDQGKLVSALEKSRPWARRIDRILRPRLLPVLEGPMRRIIALLLIFLGATMPFLELVPFAAALPAFAVLLFGLALSTQDGFLAMAAIAGTLATAYGLFSVVGAK